MQTLCQRLSNARNRLQIRKAGVFNAFSTSKMPQQGLHFLCSKAFNGLQRVLHCASSATLSMEAVHEAVRFVSRVHQDTSVTVQNEGIMTFSEHGLFAFC